MTVLVDRFAPTDGGGTEDEDCSREDVEGVLMKLAPFMNSFLTAVSRGGSLISTRSSSSLLLSRSRLVIEAASAIGDQCPSGSTVTCSTDLGVDLSMLSTYLSTNSQHMAHLQ